MKRPYSITLQAKKIIFAEIDPCLRTIKVRKLEKNRIKLQGIPTYGAAHEIEHLERGDISGIPLWTFEYIKE